MLRARFRQAIPPKKGDASRITPFRSRLCRCHQASNVLRTTWKIPSPSYQPRIRTQVSSAPRVSGPSSAGSQPGTLAAAFGPVSPCHSILP